MTSPVILWFRQDLRLTDNPALDAAVKTGEEIIPLYILDDEDAGDWKMGAASRWWLHHSLERLKKTLKDKGAHLVVRKGAAETVLKSIIKETDADGIYWNRMYEPWATQRDKKIKAELNGHSFKGALLFEPWEIESKSGTPFRVFTPFYKACLNHEALIKQPIKPTAKINGYKPLKSDDLDLMPDIKWYGGMDLFWEPGEEAAIERARDFLEHDLTKYQTDRDRPDHDGTSRLSAHLHFGEISPRALYHAAKPLAHSAAFLRELIWREFTHHVLYHNPTLPEKPLQARFAKFPWSKHYSNLEKWHKGLTGYPIVDAGMRQLWETGWMHNRVRMVVGSFLVKHMLMPWQKGEAWFWDCLVDADLAQNAFNWQWIGGCGADAAPYFRVFNPIIQGEKFDPKGDYVRRYVPELKDVPDKFIHKPWESGLKLDYPAPIIDHKLGRDRALAAFKELK